MYFYIQYSYSPARPKDHIMLWMIVKPLFCLLLWIHSPIFSALFFVPGGWTTGTVLTGLPSLWFFSGFVNESETKIFTPWQGFLQSCLPPSKQWSLLLSRQQTVSYCLCELWCLFFISYAFLPTGDGINLLLLYPGYHTVTQTSPIHTSLLVVPLQINPTQIILFGVFHYHLCLIRTLM